MQENDIYEAQKRLIESENINITETNVLRDFVQIIIKIILILVSVYISFMLISGIIINLLSNEQQIKFENIMTHFVSLKSEEFSNEEKIKTENIKNKILNIDTKFPKTANLDIKIHPNANKNALCLPNGNIYITSSLYNEIKNDEQMLFFVIAHEMAHYKNRDHIMNFRKNIASMTVVLLATIFSPDSEMPNIVSKTMELSDLNYSRGVEARADKYAGLMLLREYGTINGGIRALNKLRDKEYPNFLYIFSTHPSIEKRIDFLKNIKY